jgi:replication-associated recombination protein RarA
MMISASEDIGNADPGALTVAVSASQAVERIGMPEAQIILAQAAAYVATAPKSNTAVESVMAARRTVRETGSLPIPGYLQDAHYKGAQDLGRGIGYRYAHDYEQHYAGQPLLPEKLRGKVVVAGNLALEGAKQLAQHPGNGAGDSIVAQAEYLDLSTLRAFPKAFAMSASRMMGQRKSCSVSAKAVTRP